MKYKSIIFDVDGTLVDSYELYLNCLKKSLKKYKGLDLEIEDLSFTFGMTNEMVLEHFGIEKEKEFMMFLQEEYERGIDGLKLYSGIKKIVTTLYNKGIKLGVVTSRTDKELYLDPSLFPILDMFISRITVDKEEPKPSKKPVLKCIEEMNSNIESTLYIGDTEYDKLACKNAGVDFALAHYSNVYEDIEADYYIKDVKDILKYI